MEIQELDGSLFIMTFAINELPIKLANRFLPTYNQKNIFIT